MLLKIGIWTLAALGLIFVVLPFFNVTFFDIQCEENIPCGPSCSARTILPDKKGVLCKPSGPDAGCSQDCASRSKRCGFDEEIKNSCVECVQNCDQLEANSEIVQSCYNKCYNQTS